ncbi:MAG: DUF1648 domain-containing protein [Bdellovibrionaceae bacterium]|nr:DUF1648 domain-containing protein [Pseudobdellovibrionaceae bacterium]
MKALLRPSIPALLLTVLSFALPLLFWKQMPEQVPIHFDIQGQADREAPKAVGLFILPGLSLFLIVLMSFFAKLDPALMRDPDGPPSLGKFLGAIGILLLGIQAGLILTSVYPDRLLMNEMLFISMGLFMIVFGLSMRHMPMNPWIGFRYPWNYQNRAVWRRTHDLYYRWMIVFGVLSLVFAFVMPIPPVSLALLLLAIVVPAIISYRFSRQGPPSPRDGPHRRGRRRGGQRPRAPKPS